MNRYALHRRNGCCPVELAGETLSEAVLNGWHAIATEAHLGNAAGYRVESVEAEYRPGILGGKGGVELEIRAAGGKLAHHNAPPLIQRYHIWIAATHDDCPERIDLSPDYRRSGHP